MLLWQKSRAAREAAMTPPRWRRASPYSAIRGSPFPKTYCEKSAASRRPPGPAAAGRRYRGSGCRQSDALDYIFRANALASRPPTRDSVAEEVRLLRECPEQRVGGHKTLAMVLRYTHLHGRHIDHAIAAIGRTRPKQLPNGAA